MGTIWAKVGKWRIGQSSKGKADVSAYEPLNAQADMHEVVVKDPLDVEPRQNAELVNEGLNRLVEQLESINDNLGKQAVRHDALLDRIDKLPDLLSSVPKAAQSQMEVASALVDQLKEK
ncbi:MAG: hypothetical protein KAS23_00605, partial [Anaerohalosphaera sp.]|nr:hypothetical protein [Anaerohalosphaera sp.]